MLKLFAAAISTTIIGSAAFAQSLAPPPAPPKRPVNDTYYGTTISDPYRYMENLDDPAVIGWIKAEGDYTRQLFASIPQHANLVKQVEAFTGSFDFVNGLQREGGRLFYEEQAPGSDNFDLLVRDANGATRKLVDVAAWRAAHGGKPYAINYFLASPDGNKVAVGLSEGGSEDASMYVYDVASGKQIAGPLPRARFGATGWSDDSKLVFLNQLADLPAGAPATDKYENSRALVWDLKSAPVPLLGGGTPSSINVPAVTFPIVSPVPGSRWMIAMVINGVQNERQIWVAPASSVTGGKIAWRQVATTDDDVTNVTAAGDRLYLLSHKGAPTFQVLELDAGDPIAAAKVVVPARPDVLIENIGAAADGVYVSTRHGVYSEVLRVPLAGGAATPIALPFKGSIGSAYTDPTQSGAVLSLDSWTHPPTVFAYDPATATFSDLKLGGGPASFDPSKLHTVDLAATAKDGVAVPLSYTELDGLTKPHVVLLEAYGSYGISEFPAFGARTTFVMEQGIGFGVCHVRGGGELGEAWRLGGKDANKPNTWRDLIACGRYLVAQGYTTPDKLFIIGGSAGGITMGRALEEAPDLFAGVIDEVPVANPVRQEFSPNGIPNIPEFGTVKTEAGFHNLYAMDSYLHVKDGTHYPAVMLTTGLNDPRVASWEPAKFAARLQDSGTKAPVLLRVDEQAGHGIGSTRTQSDKLYADILSFIKWQSGDKAWRPEAIGDGK